jgi:ribosomal protein L11 methyltransferase
MRVFVAILKILRYTSYMSRSWLEIQFRIPEEALDLVSQHLLEIDCVGIVAADRPLDTFTPPNPDLLKNDPWIKAYFVSPPDIDQHLQDFQRCLIAISGLYPELASVPFEFRTLEDEDWASDWQQHFPPIRVGSRLVIHPSWVRWEKNDQETSITLDPGQAFGTGTHATTRLCLAAMATHFESASPSQKVLDVGTGSGILAMAAAKLGAVKVVALDIDPEACEVARQNLLRNKLDHCVQVKESLLSEIQGTYDLVLVNILASEIIRMAKDLVDCLSPPGGRLVLSGILNEQQDKVLDAFKPFPVALLDVTRTEEWCCIVFERL